MKSPSALQHGVVLGTVNTRLGALGLLVHPESSIAMEITIGPAGAMRKQALLLRILSLLFLCYGVTQVKFEASSMSPDPL